MKYSFIDQYTTLPKYVSNNIPLGFGSYRVYLNSGSTKFHKESYGVNNCIKILCLTNTVFSSISDAENNDNEGDGGSANSQLIIGMLHPAGTILFGNYDNIKLSQGCVLIHGIQSTEVYVSPIVLLPSPTLMVPENGLKNIEFPMNITWEQGVQN